MSRALTPVDQQLVLPAIPALLDTFLAANFSHQPHKDLDALITMYDDWARSLSPKRKTEVTLQLVRKLSAKPEVRGYLERLQDEGRDADTMIEQDIDWERNEAENP